MVSFRKMHGLGNDFVIIDGRKAAVSLTSSQIVQIGDRRRGVGFDQLIVLEKPKDAAADLFMQIYNPDGSESGACGNATRCVADIIMREKGADKAIIQTQPGLLTCTRAGAADVAVDMGPALLDWSEIPLSAPCDTLRLPLSLFPHPGPLPEGEGGTRRSREGEGNNAPVAVNVGNPHCVFFVENAETVDVAGIGAKTEIDPLFPQKTNVEFASLIGKDHLRMRVWERGAGITQACGTGACATAVAAIRRGLTGRKVTVTLDGGNLVIEWREDNGHVLMTGPLAYSFEGTIVL